MNLSMRTLLITGALLGLGMTQLVAQGLQGHGFSLQAAGAFQKGRVELAPRLTSQEIGTDIPYDVAPRRVQFHFPIGDQGATLDVIPLSDASVKDFGKAYPDLDLQAKALKKLLGEGRLPSGLDLPVWNCPDAEQTIHARVRILETPWCRGVQFLTRYTQESCVPIDNSALMYTFQGLSRDGNYYVALDIPITQAALPKEGKPLLDTQIKAHYLQSEKLLNEASEESFQPSLQSVHALIQSLKPIESRL